MPPRKKRKPKRVQRRRTAGWRMPPNTKYVGRPTVYGNPYSLADYDAETCMANFRQHAETMLANYPEIRRALRGFDLACWCKLSDICHADIWLELVNP